MPKRKTILEDSYQALTDKMRQDTANDKWLDFKDVMLLFKYMQEHEMDSHCGIFGNNGLGKTMLELLFGWEYYGKDEDALFNNLITAEDTIDDLVLYVLRNHRTLCMIDELNVFLYYYDHASAEQKHLIKSMELARSKCIAYLGCGRDPRKTNNNWRNSKLSIVLWIVDRYEDGGSYAAVLVAPPSVEGEDRFGLDLLPQHMMSFDEIRYWFERLPTFCGWLEVENAQKKIPKGLLDRYMKVKETAMAWSHANWCLERYRKGKMPIELMVENMRGLAAVLGQDAVDAFLMEKGVLKNEDEEKNRQTRLE